MQEHHLQKDTDTSVAKLAPQEADQDTELPKEDEAITPLEGKTGETIHIHYFPDAIVILREGEEDTQEENVIDSTVTGTTTTEGHTEQTLEQEAVPLLNGKEQTRLAILTGSLNICLILSCLLLQVYLLLNPPTATVTLIPKSQQVTLPGTLQLGRILAPLTLSQSQTVPTTGKGHQIARAATGSITFYNGQLNSVTVPAGTVLTGASGMPIVTDQGAVIPPADPTATPPIFGQVTVAAHATHQGKAGNIPAYTIHAPCCSASVLAKNTTAFHGGQDEREYQTVTTHDINAVTATLKPAVEQSIQAAFQTYLQQSEGVYILPCAPRVTSDHKPGQEAAQVKVTASETCSAVAYNSQELREKGTDLLTHQAVQTLGTGYSLIGDVQVSITQAEVSRTIPTLTFSCQGIWVYALDTTSQEHIKTLIAGKTKQEALQILAALPGIEKASIRWDENTKLPNDMNAIHFVILV
jgi:hypothetical protein